MSINTTGSLDKAGGTSVTEVRGLLAELQEIYTMDTSAKTTTAYGMVFSRDGLYLYVSDTANIYQYDLSEAWNLESAVFNQQIALSTIFGALNSSGMWISDDGSHIYVSQAFVNKVLHATLSTPYDISTATDNGDEVDVSSQDAGLKHPQVSSDGTKLWIMGGANDTIFEYDLSTAFDLNSASYNSVSLAHEGASNDEGFIIDPIDGLSLYMVEPNGGLYRYSLSTAWSLSTATADPDTNPLSGITAPERVYVYEANGFVAIMTRSGSDIVSHRLPLVDLG